MGKALYYNLTQDELTVETLALEQKWYAAGTEFTLPFAQQLAEGSKYKVQFMVGDSDGYYSYICDDTDQIFEINVAEDGTTGISAVSSDDAIFKNGELVRVYDLNGILIKTVTATNSLWTELLSQLPDGNYILKSSSKSIKFRK